MPDPNLESLLMNRPVKVTGDVQYPTVQEDKGPIRNFLGAAAGIDDQQDGDIGSGLGTLVGMAIPMLPGKVKLGALGEDAALARNLLDRAIAEGTQHPRPRPLRISDTKKVNAAYDSLVEQGLTAHPVELNKLRENITGLKANGGLKPAPTGGDIPKHITTIVNKLGQIGYKVTPEDISRISELSRQASMVVGEQGQMKGTGDYAKFIRNGLPTKDKLRMALKQIPSWADGQTIKQLKSK